MCGFCGKINKNSLCNKCEIKLKNLECTKIEKVNNGYFDEQIYFFEYEGFIRKAILDYKFNNKAYIYKSFIKFIIKNKKFMEILKSYDIIIPVPISKSRYKKRGYNQSLLLSKELVNLYNRNSSSNILQVNKKCLYKIKNTIEQSKLNKEQRERNVQEVYMLKNKQIITNKNILLVDDIYTTGNTIKECSRMIKNAKPNKIGVLTISKDFVDKERI